MSKDDRELIEASWERCPVATTQCTRNECAHGCSLTTAPPATRLEALQAQPVGEEALGRALAAYNDVWQTSGAIDAGNVEAVRREAMIAALTASPPVVEREAIVDRGEIARIIDPHSFMDIPFTDDPVLLKMVEDSKGDALRKADAILALTPVEGVGELTRLRAALIEVGRNAGCLLADDVSTDFLMHVPEEVRLKLSTPVAQGDEVRAALEGYAEDAYCGMCERLVSSGEAARHALATLTKGARDAG